MIHTNKDKVLEYIDGLLRANHEAGLVIEAKHLTTIKLMLCSASNVMEPSCRPLDTSLATEPASNVAKRLLAM